MLYITVLCVFFVFKQKTAYEMRISDWSSDVCSSDLGRAARMHAHDHHAALVDAERRETLHVLHPEPAADHAALAYDLLQHVARGGGRDGEADAVDRKSVV